MKSPAYCVVFVVVCASVSAHTEAHAQSTPEPATLQIVEVDHSDRVISGWLRRVDNEQEKIPITRGKATLPGDWKPGEMLVINSTNPERYATPHYEACPLPKSNIIHIRTRLGTCTALANAVTFERAGKPLLASYAYYLVAARLSPTQDFENIANANRKCVTLLGKELGVADPVKEINGPLVVTTPAFQSRLTALQIKLGVPATGEPDYVTFKAASKGITASVLTTPTSNTKPTRFLSLPFRF